MLNPLTHSAAASPPQRDALQNLNINASPIPEAADETIDSLTSSGLLAKHSANIARLASNFGITLEQKEAAKANEPKEDSAIQFDKMDFQSKLNAMVSEPTKEKSEVKPALE